MYQKCAGQREVTKKFADKRLSFKRLKVVDVFSCSDKDDGTPSGCHAEKEGTALSEGTATLTGRKLKLALRAQSSSSFGVSIQLGDNY